MLPHEHAEVIRYLWSAVMCLSFFFTMYVMVKHAD